MIIDNFKLWLLRGTVTSYEKILYSFIKWFNSNNVLKR